MALAEASFESLSLPTSSEKSALPWDITRTVFVGHATDEAAEVYETVLKANLAGHEMTRPGVSDRR